MAYCIKCGISLEIDADTEDGEVCAQCKGNYTRVFANIWQCNDCGAYGPTTDKVVHHNVCYPDGPQKILLRGAHRTVLTNADVEVLDGSSNRSVRTSDSADAEVKRLYHMWKKL